MSFNLIAKTKNIELFENFAIEIKKTLTGNLFNPQIVVVGKNQDIKNLNVLFSDYFSINPCINYIYFDEYLNDIWKSFGNKSKLLTNNQQIIKIFHLLNNNISEFEFLWKTKDIFSNNLSGMDKWIYNSAIKINDLINNYAEHHLLLKNSTWQHPFIDRKVIYDISHQISNSKHISKVSYYIKLYEQLKKNFPNSKINQIYFWGFSNLTNYQKKVFPFLTKYFDINFYIQLPSLLQFHSISDNDTVSLCQVLASEQRKLLLYLIEETKLIEDYYELSENITIKNYNRLNILQTALINLDPPELSELAKKSLNKCNSLQINIYKNERDELVDVKNQIIELLKTDITINDILIVVSNLNQYKSHFLLHFNDNSKLLNVGYNYEVSDDYLLFFQSFIKILRLFYEKINPNIIFNILSYKMIYEKFNIVESDISSLKDLISQLGETFEYNFNDNLKFEDNPISKLIRQLSINYSSSINTTKDKNLFNKPKIELPIIYENVFPRLESFFSFYNLVVKHYKAIYNRKKYSISSWISILKTIFIDFYRINQTNYNFIDKLLLPLGKLTIFDKEQHEVDISIIVSLLNNTINIKNKTLIFNNLNAISIKNISSETYKVIFLLGTNKDNLFEKQNYDANQDIDDEFTLGYNSQLLKLILNCQKKLVISFAEKQSHNPTNSQHWSSLKLINNWFKNNYNIEIINYKKELNKKTKSNFKKYYISNYQNYKIDQYSQNDVININQLTRFWHSPIKYYLNNIQLANVKKTNQTNKLSNKITLSNYSKSILLSENIIIDESKDSIFSNQIRKYIADGEIGIVQKNELKETLIELKKKLKIKLTHKFLNINKVVICDNNEKILLRANTSGYLNNNQNLVKFKWGTITWGDIIEQIIKKILIEEQERKNVSSTIMFLNEKKKSSNSKNFIEIKVNNNDQFLINLINAFRNNQFQPFIFSNLIIKNHFDNKFNFVNEINNPADFKKTFISQLNSFKKNPFNYKLFPAEHVKIEEKYLLPILKDNSNETINKIERDLRCTTQILNDITIT